MIFIRVVRKIRKLRETIQILFIAPARTNVHASMDRSLYTELGHPHQSEFLLEIPTNLNRSLGIELEHLDLGDSEQ